MSEHICGLAAGESRFDSSLKHDESGALGIFQLMPATIANPRLNPDKYPQNEVRYSLKKQVEIAKRLFLTDWELIHGRFAKKIADNYFNGNREDAIRYALFPILMNTYNTGYKNIDPVIRGFIKEYQTIQDIEETFEVSYKDGLGYDFFWYFSRFGLAHG